MNGMNLLCLLILSACCSGVLAQPCVTPWKDCGSTGMKIDNVTIQGCKCGPCPIKEGTNASISVSFTPSKLYNT